MRRRMCGFETNDLTFMRSSTQTGTMTVGASASAARTASGTYGMRVDWTTTTTRGKAYAEWAYDDGFCFNSFPNAGSSGIGFLDAATNRSIGVRWYYRTDMPNTSANTARIFGISTGTGFAAPVGPSVLVLRSGTDRLVRLLGGTGGGTTTGTVSLAASTWYRFQLFAEIDSSGNGAVTLTIYNENTFVAVESLSATIGTGANIHNYIQFGYIDTGNIVTLNGAQTHDFEDIAVNDAQVAGSNVHRPQNLGPGSILAVHYPITPDLATGWTALGGGTHWSEVDEAVPDDATSYVYSTTAATVTDRFTHTAYGGSDTITAVTVQAKHIFRTAPSGNDVFHDVGLYDGSNYLTVSLPGVSTWSYFHCCVHEKYGGGALAVAGDNSWYSSASIALRRYQDLAGTNDKNVTSLRVEVEDNDGLTWKSLPNPSPTRPMRGLIGR